MGWTQEQLCERSGVKQGTISKIERGDQETSAFNLQLATVLEISPHWLDREEGNMLDRHVIVSDRGTAHEEASMTASAGTSDSGAGHDGTNVTPGPGTKGHVPLISWVSAGKPEQVEDPYYVGEAEEFIPCPASHSLHSYALRVEGDSMTAAYGKSYPHGCIIYVDPEQRGGVVSGERVTAKINDNDKAIFKVFVEEDGKRFLKPLNPQHPIITDEFRILGKVIGKYEPE